MIKDLEKKDRMSFLKDEYLLLQNQYEDYDRRSLTIKGWVGSGAAAALALAFNSSYRAALFIPIFVSVIAAVFWYLEAYWKVFQYALSDRIRVIEAFFRDDPDILIRDPAPFQIYHFWFKSFAEDTPIYEYEKSYRPKPFSYRLREAASQSFVMVLYVCIIGLSLFSFVILLLARLHPEWKLIC
jgi:hypothetical protein